MIEMTWIRCISLVRRSRLAQILLLAVVLSGLLGTAYYGVSKPIQVAVDGQQVNVRTIWPTVGQFLAHSHLGFFEEDQVDLPRDTAVFAGMQIQVVRSQPVTLDLDGEVLKARVIAQSAGAAVNEISERYALGLKASDELNVAADDGVESGMVLVVHRTIPVQLTVDGEEMERYVAPCTVAEALERWEIILGALDQVSLPLEQALQPEDALRVVRVEEKEEIIQEELPYQVVVKPGEFPVGLPDQILTAGQTGLHEQTVRLKTEDGQEVQREVLSQRILKAPVTQVVARGNQTTIARGSETFKFERCYTMRATAYCFGTTTATGAKVRRGIVAVDPRVIPLGTRLYVEGYGEAVALDTGGAIKGERIDVYVPTYAEAAQWGVRNVTVYVLD
jgi:uncharacterized protein YabE (DUF348 family)